MQMFRYHRSCFEFNCRSKISEFHNIVFRLPKESQGFINFPKCLLTLQTRKSLSQPPTSFFKAFTRSQILQVSLRWKIKRLNSARISGALLFTLFSNTTLSKLIKPKIFSKKHNLTLHCICTIFKRSPFQIVSKKPTGR